MATLYSQDNISHTQWATTQKSVNVPRSNTGVTWHNSWLTSIAEGSSYIPVLRDLIEDTLDKP
jgi:hypothetical protein